MSYDKPMPLIDVWNRPFWEACREGRLIAQKCLQSGEVWFPPAPISPVSRTEQWEWVHLSGMGRVASWVVFHKGYFKGFSAELPYVVAQIDLQEGPSLLSNLIDVEASEITTGMPVEVVFQNAAEGMLIPCFKKRKDAA
ncbi:Predicted nucleic-acid-binding protein containing a Zn-ribbon [Bordetella ansorpii]|uniref:Predicted nucleic-acid-binding protein containing a Zn-ribbon n=2 Tax=Bordetella ansorpii TaxID=288768 RepID=A0A157SIL9_9BORD|nr:Predicted nucleic-acid-binding protein containing a Zn-ribbon [Bordetella ansorpii]